MDERRYQVFVSSTFLDLQEERAAVVSALLQMDAFPAGMELFPAADDDAWTLIQRVIDSSDYYILVIGGKYGSVDPETELSYTEMEYDYAVAQGKPVMALLHANPEKIEFGKSEKEEAAQDRLEAFREKVKAQKHVKFWDGPEDLAGKVALSFVNFQKTYPAVGWIRGDTQTSAEALAELNDVRKQLADTQRSLATAHAGPPPGSERLSQRDEEVDFQPKLEVEVRHSGHESSWDSATYTGRLSESVTWDDLFAAIGHDLLDEGNEGKMLRGINTYLSERFADTAKAIVTKSVASDGFEVQRFKRIQLSLDPADFGTVIVQFRALGLIAKSTRKRSVKDTATYWSLTPYGDERLTGLRAIVRSSADEVDEAGPRSEDREGEGEGEGERTS